MNTPARFAALVMMCVLLAACAAPSPQQGGEPLAGIDSAASPATTVAPPRLPAKPPRMSTPLPPQQVEEAAAPIAPGKAVVVDTICRTDADCAIKDVGNCCGAYPACVNKDSPTDPAGVRAQCARSGMASVCGFRAVTACTCTAGRCADAGTPSMRMKR